jgi:S-adenosylmethionine:tRNA ribosyltransferase-isomerase
MKLSEFKFDLPNNLIALHPAENRDDARLMVIHKDTGKIEHKVFKDIVSYFGEGDVFVGNDTLVFPARLYGRKEKTGAKIEVFLAINSISAMATWLPKSSITPPHADAPSASCLTATPKRLTR